MKRTLTFLVMLVFAVVVVTNTTFAAPPTVVIDNNQWNNAINNEHVAYIQAWAAQNGIDAEAGKLLAEAALSDAANAAVADGVVDDIFDWGDAQDFDEWSGVLKIEYRDGDHTANIYGRYHGMLVLSQASFKTDGAVEAFVMINELFLTWFDEGGFDEVGYPTSKPFEHEGTLYQNFSNGYINDEGEYYEDMRIAFDGTVTHFDENEEDDPVDLLGVLVTEDGGQSIETHPAYGWVRELGAEVIKAEIERVYQEMTDLGIDFGIPVEPVKLWSAAGDGSGGAEETRWLRQEFVDGDHEAYLWNRVHGYIFVNQDGEGFAVYNDILLEWHGGWSDKGGPTSQPIYVTVEFNGVEVTDIYQNFQNVYIVIPSGDRSLAQTVVGESIDQESALAASRERYGLDDSDPDPDPDPDPNPDPNPDPSDDASFPLVWILTLSITGGAILIGGGIWYFLKKNKK